MPTIRRQSILPQVFGFAIVLAALLPAYLPFLQSIPNGSDNPYMIDVGETQVVLNVWGTLHATGYPLYVITGAALVGVFKALGVSAAAAPAAVSLLWGVVALALIYTLALHLTGRVLAAAAATLVYGLTRTVWIHNDVAEVYTFGLAILALLLLIALWRGPIRGRIYWLALLGGVGVAEHRALAMAAPALIVAAWGELSARRRRLPTMLALCLLLGLAGFLPYVYLPLRAQAGAAWVYGEPGTWAGFWDQFSGREASRFIGAPSSEDGLAANVALVNGVLVTDLTLPGLALGAPGLALGLRRQRTRRAATVLLVSGLSAYGFHVLFYSDVLYALILPITLSAAFGWLFVLDAFLGLAPGPRSESSEGRAQDSETERHPGMINHAPAELAQSNSPGISLLQRPGTAVKHLWRDVRRISFSGRHWTRVQQGAVVVVTAAAAGVLIGRNLPFVESLTSDRTGLDTIALARETPPGATLMIAWGPRHFAVGFAREVQGDLRDIGFVSHKADFETLVARGPLVTPAYTFYNQPVDWWQAQIGAPVYLHTIAPDLVQISTQPEMAAPGAARQPGPLEAALTCDARRIILRVAWAAPETPAQDLSVFVHLLGADGTLLAQADQSAPVYGWRPLTSWQPNEIVRDLYPLPRVPAAATVEYGLYRQLASGAFDNVIQESLPVQCGTE